MKDNTKAGLAVAVLLVCFLWLYISLEKSQRELANMKASEQIERSRALNFPVLLERRKEWKSR